LGGVDAAASASTPVAIRNPLVVVAGFAEVDCAVEWVSRLGAIERPRVTFVHVIDTVPFFRGLESGGLSLVELVVDAERDGTSLLEMLRSAAPGSVSVTTRLLKAPLSQPSRSCR
jgi:nucleotide-binding universal stress UspA family protein